MALKISRILHAGYVFECDGAQIAFDPILENPFSSNCHAFPNVQFDLELIQNLEFSAVFISHFHDDHCSLESLDLLNRRTPIYIYCIFEELELMIREMGFTHVHSLVIDVPVQISSFEITPRRALDADVDSIFQIKVAGVQVLNVVDSWIDPLTLKTLADQGPWDVVLWPFQTMREVEVLTPTRATKASNELPSEWIEQLQSLKPKFIVPSSCQFVQESWSWYNHALFPISYRKFQQEIESILPDSRVVRLNPSVSVVLDQNGLEASPALNWILPVGHQDVDYDYIEDIVPTPTAEISRHFAPLGLEQEAHVDQYCRSGLLEKYQSMETPKGEFFQKPRLWKLSIFDHRGDVRHFHYLLNGRKIQVSNENEGILSWCTEVPISKFHAALVSGESLTSMYLRINNWLFDPEVEKELQTVDIVDDPLVRCLFNGVFGAYQLAQLKRLKMSSSISHRI